MHIRMFHNLVVTKDLRPRKAQTAKFKCLNEISTPETQYRCGTCFSSAGAVRPPFKTFILQLSEPEKVKPGDHDLKMMAGPIAAGLAFDLRCF